MAEDGFAALLVEFSDPVRLDVPLAVESEFLFDSEFNGKPVAVPTRFARYEVPLHGFEARKDVLEDTCLNVVGARNAVRRWRTFVDDPRRPIFGLGEAAVKDVAIRPEFKDFTFHCREVDAWGHGAIHAG